MPTPGLIASHPSYNRNFPSTISCHVAALASRHYPNQWDNRRHETRTPVPFLLELTPHAPPGECSPGPMVVVGKDLSEAGIGFFHQQPIPQRRVRLRLEGADPEPLEFDVEILWCHFTRQGWYESGGRILGMVEGSAA